MQLQCNAKSMFAGAARIGVRCGSRRSGVSQESDALTAARKSTQTLASHLLIFLQGLVLTPFVIKVAGQETYGTYALLISYLGVLFGISSLGIGVLAKRRLPGTISAEDRSAWFYPQFWFQLHSVAVLSGASLGAYVLLARIMDWKLPGFPLGVVPAYLLAFTVHSQAADYFRNTHRVGRFNLCTVSQPYLFVALVIAAYAIWGVLNIRSLMMALAVSCILVGGISLLAVGREIGVKFVLPGLAAARAEIMIGFPLVLSYFVDVILAGGDRYIVAAMLSVRAVGAYVPAYALGSLILVLPKVFGVVLPPLLAQRIDAGDEIGARRLTTGAAKLFIVVSVPYVAGSALLGRDVLMVYANAEIAAAAWQVIPIVALASIFCGLTLIRASVLFVRLETAALLRINVIGMAANIVANVVLIALFGNLVVAALATLLSYVFNYVLLSKRLATDAVDFDLGKQWLSGVVFSSLGMALALGLFRVVSPSQGMPAIALDIAIGCGVYWALTFAARENRDEFAGMFRSLTRSGA